jgi:receptor protein-tyrosine kinase
MPETQRSSLRPPLASFLPVARRWRWMLLAAALAAGVAGYVTAAGSGRAYESRADILVGSVNSGNNDDLQASGRAAQTYAQLATTRALLKATEDRLASATSRRRDGDGQRHDAHPDDRRPQLRQAAGARHRQHARPGARRLRRRRRTAPDEPGSLQIVDPAVISDSPVGPDPVTVAILAAIAGLIGALALALLLDRSGDAVREARTSRRRPACLPGHAAARRAAARALLAVGRRGRRSRRGAGAYRMLAAKVEILAGPGLVVVTLGRSGGIVAVNLATAMAATGARVAVVDAEGTDSAIGAVRDPQTAPAALGAEGSGPAGGRVRREAPANGRSSSEGSGCGARARARGGRAGGRGRRPRRRPRAPDGSWPSCWTRATR